MDSFQYIGASSELTGGKLYFVMEGMNWLSGFDWSLHFKWDTLTSERKSQRKSPIEPIK